MARALKKAGASVDHYSTQKTEQAFDPRRLFRRLSRHLRHRPASLRTTIETAKRDGQALQRLLAGKSYDFIFAPLGSSLIAYLDVDIPIVHATDATPRLLIKNYPRYNGAEETMVEVWDHFEHRAIERATLVTCAAEWAAQSAISDYGAEPGKVVVIPWGANFDDEPDASIAEQRRLETPYRILFLNTDWKRKGGDVAVETIRRLREENFPVELTVCGDAPADLKESDGIRLTGRLNKDNLQQREQLYEILRSHHLLLFPTLAECFGHVICEASAYGMPVVARRTGGITTAIQEGRNGFTIEEDEGPAAYAECIRNILADPEKYRRLCLSSRKDYENRLNWGAWVNRLVGAVAERAPLCGRKGIPIS